MIVNNSFITLFLIQQLFLGSVSGSRNNQSLKKPVITCISNQSKRPYQAFLMPICEEKHETH